jgi:hypothetical protein
VGFTKTPSGLIIFQKNTRAQINCALASQFCDDNNCSIIKQNTKTTNFSVMRDYLFLPEKYHCQHDVCFELTMQIEDFLTNPAYNELRIQTIEGIQEVPDEGEHILDFWLRIGRKDVHDYIVKMQVINGLLLDICYFTQEALTCSIKQRLTVTFALLRKPFVYSLIVMLRVLLDETFMDRFNTDNMFDPADVSSEDRDALLDASLQLIQHNPVTVTNLKEWIFDRKVESSLINMSDKALHLNTTRNKHHPPKAQQFNFVFSDESTIYSQWDYLYSRLPALLLYLVQVTDTVIFTSLKLPDAVYVERMTARAAFLKKYRESRNVEDNF